LQDVPEPTVRSDAYLIRVLACGICTWEQRVYRGISATYPFAAGHEIGGVIQSAPQNGLSAGTTVAVSLLPRCGDCITCRLGLDNLCAYLNPSETSEGPGGLIDLLVADRSDIAPLPTGRTAGEAALVEPLACVLNSLAVARVSAGTRVAVIGNGFMGVLHARAARAMDADVTLIKTGPSPRGLAGVWDGPELGFPEDASPTPSDHDSSFDVAIVIRGAPENLTSVAHLLRPGGTVSVYASLSGDSEISLPTPLIRRKQLTLTAAASHRRVDFESAAEWIGEGAVEVADLIYDRFTIECVQEALTLACESDSSRVLVTIGDP
jgi:L-iditol 2-dehydrogenase